MVAPKKSILSQRTAVRLPLNGPPYPAMDWYFTHAAPQSAGDLNSAYYYQAKVLIVCTPAQGCKLAIVVPGIVAGPKRLPYTGAGKATRRTATRGTNSPRSTVAWVYWVYQWSDPVGRRLGLRPTWTGSFSSRGGMRQQTRTCRPTA